MPLLLPILQQKLQKLFNPQTMPASQAESADMWADAVDSYANAVIPASTTAAVAKQGFAAAMQTISADAGNGLVVLSAAFTKYAVDLGVGMAPVFTGVPPPAPLVLDPVAQAGLSGASGDTCASLLATQIDVWFRTATAVQNSSGAIVPWS